MLSIVHKRMDDVLVWTENLAAIVAGCAALITMLLVTFDALLRHLFAWPLTFQLHLTQYYLLVALTMLGLSWGYRTGGAIQIRLLMDKLPQRCVASLIRIGLLASSLYMAALAWHAALVFHRAWTRDQVIMGVIDWPVAWSWIWVPIGCGLLALRLLLDATAPRLRPIGASH
ncbi:TRAP transporter small permease [Billgrantia endophytica]|uniref:TRAP transporter small permease protein n=1 Tax=Billgrantia endophytica TaxID=2033802 RepID=A0A2N7TXR2_9GAMM|nr:TRAP transporter small permease [Halomonas endophytica]PMR72978.1 TRAP transporter small permease [Halomonas endophytica]